MFESKGIKRNLGILFATIGSLISVVPLPQVSVWGELITQLGIALGAVGLGHAAIAGTLTK